MTTRTTVEIRAAEHEIAQRRNELAELDAELLGPAFPWDDAALLYAEQELGWRYIAPAE